VKKKIKKTAKTPHRWMKELGHLADGRGKGVPAHDRRSGRELSRKEKTSVKRVLLEIVI